MNSLLGGPGTEAPAAAPHVMVITPGEHSQGGRSAFGVGSREWRKSLARLDVPAPDCRPVRAVIPVRQQDECQASRAVSPESWGGCEDVSNRLERACWESIEETERVILESSLITELAIVGSAGRDQLDILRAMGRRHQDGHPATGGTMEFFGFIDQVESVIHRAPLLSAEESIARRQILELEEALRAKFPSCSPKLTKHALGVARRREVLRERGARMDLDTMVGEFLATFASDPRPLDDWEELEADKKHPPIGLLIGSDPVYDQDFPIYRWYDPTRRQGNKKRDVAGRCTSRPVPPCATPVQLPSFRSRNALRLSIGPVWWQTGEEVITPAAGDILFSLVGPLDAVDQRYFQNGDWDMNSVINVQAGKRVYSLGELQRLECGDQVWEYRRVIWKYRTARYTELFGPWFGRAFGATMLETRPIRPKMLPRGRSWETEIMHLTSHTTRETISARYKAVIRRTPENLVSQMRAFELAALQAECLAANPVAQLRVLLSLEAAGEIEQGPGLTYAPR